MSELADTVLPLVRTRSDVSRWSTASAHDRQMHAAVDLLEATIPVTEPGEAYAVTTKALVSYRLVDSVAVIPVLRRLVERDLVHADAQRYRAAARKLCTVRRLATGLPQAVGVDDDIARLRELHRRRPRLQQELDRARLP